MCPDAGSVEETGRGPGRSSRGGSLAGAMPAGLGSGTTPGGSTESPGEQERFCRLLGVCIADALDRFAAITSITGPHSRCAGCVRAAIARHTR